MPELPEVETIRQGLLGRIEGVKVAALESHPCRVFQVSRDSLTDALVGHQFRRLERLGKFLIFGLDAHVLVIHLGMTGQLTLRDPRRHDSPDFFRHPTTGLQRVRQHPPDRHTHLQIHFEDGRSLLYRDMRTFGKVYLLTPREAARDRFFARVGLEPFSDEYTLDSFLVGFGERKLRIKSLLLDQKFVAGVGNIYADEALFACGIHPCRRAHRLGRFEKEWLFQSVKGVLEKGLHFGGTSLRDYIDSDGQRGTHQEELMAYGREGKPCRVCGSGICKIVVSQRGTHFCAACQPRAGQKKSEMRLFSRFDHVFLKKI